MHMRMPGTNIDREYKFNMYNILIINGARAPGSQAWHIYGRHIAIDIGS